MLGVIIIVAIIYFTAKSAGKRKAAKDLKNDLIAPISGISGQQINNVARLNDRLKEDIYSKANWLGGVLFNPTRDIEAYQLALVLSDTELKQMHNDWLARFYDEDNETLKVAIANEKDLTVTGSFRNIRDSLVEKLNRLGL